MISRKDIIELASNFKFRSKEYNLIEKLGDYYLTQPKLDSEVEEYFRLDTKEKIEGLSIYEDNKKRELKSKIKQILEAHNEK